MRLVNSSAIAVALAMLLPPVTSLQGQGQDAALAVAGGGISLPGWTGKIDANEEKQGQVLNNAKLARRRQDHDRHDRTCPGLLESRRTRRRATTR